MTAETGAPPGAAEVKGPEASANQDGKNEKSILAITKDKARNLGVKLRARLSGKKPEGTQGAEGLKNLAAGTTDTDTDKSATAAEATAEPRGLLRRTLDRVRGTDPTSSTDVDNTAKSEEQTADVSKLTPDASKWTFRPDGKFEGPGGINFTLSEEKKHGNEAVINDKVHGSVGDPQSEATARAEASYALDAINAEGGSGDINSENAIVVGHVISWPSESSRNPYAFGKETSVADERQALTEEYGKQISPTVFSDVQLNKGTFNHGTMTTIHVSKDGREGKKVTTRFRGGKVISHSISPWEPTENTSTYCDDAGRQLPKVGEAPATTPTEASNDAQPPVDADSGKVEEYTKRVKELKRVRRWSSRRKKEAYARDRQALRDEFWRDHPKGESSPPKSTSAQEVAQTAGTGPKTKEEPPTMADASDATTSSAGEEAAGGKKDETYTITSSADYLKAKAEISDLTDKDEIARRTKELNESYQTFLDARWKPVEPPVKSMVTPPEGPATTATEASPTVPAPSPDALWGSLDIQDAGETGEQLLQAANENARGWAEFSSQLNTMAQNFVDAAAEGGYRLNRAEATQFALQIMRDGENPSGAGGAEGAVNTERFGVFIALFLALLKAAGTTIATAAAEGVSELADAGSKK